MIYYSNYSYIIIDIITEKFKLFIIINLKKRNKITY